MIMAINVEPDSRTSSSMVAPSCADPEGFRTPLENSKNKGFLSNTGPNPLKITKLPIQHSMFGHYRPASETSWWPANNGFWIHPPLIKLKKTKQKKRQSWTSSGKLSGSAHGHYTRKPVLRGLRPDWISLGIFNSQKQCWVHMLVFALSCSWS